MIRIASSCIRVALAFLAIVALVSRSSRLAAQDWHFSQFQANPLTLDPAMAGNFSGDLRVAMHYRNQWNFAAQFHTVSIAADAPILRFKNYDYFAASVHIISDQAGDLRFRTTQVNAGLAYHKRMNPYKDHYLSAGYQAGYAQRSVDFSRVVAFDPEPGVLLENGQFSFLDMAAGMNWYLAPGRNKFYYAGLGMFHLNRPDMSFLRNGSAPLDIRTTLYAGASMPLGRTTYWQPVVVYLDQGPHRELNLGLSLRWWLNPDQVLYQKERAIALGLWYRLQDALVFSARFDYRDFNIGLSYDLNLSKLSQVSNLNGGPEISIIYVLNKGKAAEGALQRQMYCPHFF